METAELVNFEEIVKNHTYDIPKYDETITSTTAFKFENFNQTKIKQSQSRQKLLDFSLISMDFLKMVNKNGLPTFAVYNVNQENCNIKASIDKDDYVTFSINASTQKDIQKIYRVFAYQELKKAIKQEVSIFLEHKLRSVSIDMVSQFNGIIPLETRNYIKLHQHKFDEVLVIAESEKWTVNKQVTYMPPNPDPLVVGVKDGLVYYICSFDVTKLEQYIKREFVE